MGLIQDILLGYACEWDLSSADLTEHKVHDGAVVNMAVSGDRIVTHDYANDVIRVFTSSTCLLVLS